MVVDSLQRGNDGSASQVAAEVLPPEVSPRAHVRGTVDQDAILYTDSVRIYVPLATEYKHQTVDRSRGEYVRGAVSTNGIENSWTLLKRGLDGAYVAVSPEHLFRYIDERAFTFNERDKTDLERLQTVLGRVAGRGLTYAKLTT
jgi:hypothetical protein